MRDLVTLLGGVGRWASIVGAGACIVPPLEPWSDDRTRTTSSSRGWSAGLAFA